MILIFALFALNSYYLSVNAAQTTNWDSTAALNRVNTIGQKLLSANNISQKIEFKVSNEDTVNAYADINKEIHVYRGLLEYVETDDELAGVIGHEMGHIVNGHCAKQGILGAGISAIFSGIFKNQTAQAVSSQLAQNKISRNDEFEADITGVDIMTKAGYNPLGMVSLLSKISSNYVDFFQTHPSGDKRILNAYNYIEYNYPSKIALGYNTASYKNALSIIEPEVQKRQNSAKAMEQFKNEQEKLLVKKQKRIQKMQKTNTVWDGYLMTLQYLGN